MRSFGLLKGWRGGQAPFCVFREFFLGVFTATSIGVSGSDCFESLRTECCFCAARVGRGFRNAHRSRGEGVELAFML